MLKTFINIDAETHKGFIDDCNTLKFQDERTAYEPAKNPRYNIHCFEVMQIFSNINARHTYLQCSKMEWITKIYESERLKGRTRTELRGRPVNF